jgi:tRNA (pseudouridine54-N1)-methyltransferase
MTRSFVIVGTKATASPDFSLVDLAGTSGRLDVLLRCVRSALLVSHGLRRDTTVYLVLLGGAGSGELAPRVLRVIGADVKFLRPDERALATLAQKVLAEAPRDAAQRAFVDVRPGVAVARGGVEAAIVDVRARADASGSAPPRALLLDEGGADVRGETLDAANVAVFLGDHFGIDPASPTNPPGSSSTAAGPTTTTWRCSGCATSSAAGTSIRSIASIAVPAARSSSRAHGRSLR